MSLAGKRIVITGGAGVLGQGVAQIAQSHGADVVLIDVVPDALDLVGSLIRVDLTDQPVLNNALSRSATSMCLPISPADLPWAQQSMRPMTRCGMPCSPST